MSTMSTQKHPIEHAGKTAEILLVEDNEGDILLTFEAFKSARVSNHISAVRDGEEAIEYLHKQGQFHDAITPDIILLDLNLPKKDGRQVLQEIKQHPDLKRIPVVVLTSSKSEWDVVNTYNRHANSYIVKPVTLEKFAEVISAIENFWFTIVVLPSDVQENPTPPKHYYANAE